MGLRPPGIAASWDECSPDAKAWLIAYNRVRSKEEDKEKEFMLTGKYR